MSLLAEQYLNEIQVAGGYFSAKPISTTSTLAAGNTTVTGTANVSGVLTVGSIVNSGALTGSTQALSGAGAVNVTTTTTKVTSTGANALTLADGVDGQIKFIVMVVDGGDATLTPTTKTGFSTIVFNDAGDGVGLVFTTTTGWIVFANNGATIS